MESNMYLMASVVVGTRIAANALKVPLCTPKLKPIYPKDVW
jgi:hypothetical protein